MSGNEITSIPSEVLEAYAAALLRAAGLTVEMAKTTAASLVWANLRGVDSHGVLRIPRYVELIRKGAIKSYPEMRVQRRAPAIAVLEADLAPGAVAMSRAMTAAVDCAREAGIGWCAARNITHAGAIGYFALQAAEAGFIGIAMTASGPMMAYHGAAAAAVSSNPLAIAFPAAGRRPYLLDMSTSTVAMGKILSARDAGRPIPHGWGIDGAGQPTTDPKAVKTLTPLGGPKGAGLSFMIELLCSVSTLNPIIAPVLKAGIASDSPYLNGVAIACDLAAFGNADSIAEEARELGEAIAKLPAVDPSAGILLPGERGDHVMEQRKLEGIPLPAGTWARLLKTGSELGVDAP